MSKNYSVLPLNTEDGDFIWCVWENHTEQLIKAFAFEEEAEDYSQFMNSGGAFDGFTPSFILQEVASLLDVNQEFSSFVAE